MSFNRLGNESPTIDKAIRRAMGNENNNITLDHLSTYNKFRLSKDQYIVFANYDILKKYEAVLLSKSLLIDFPSNFKYRPEALSAKLYNTVDLWYLIMFLNKLDDPSKLNGNKVRVLDPSKIKVLNEILAKEKNVINNYNNPLNGDFLEYKSVYSKSNALIRKNFKVYKPNKINHPNINEEVIYNNLLSIEGLEHTSDFGSDTLQGYVKRTINDDIDYITTIDSSSNSTLDNKIVNSFKFESTLFNHSESYITLQPIFFGTGCSLELNGNRFNFKDNTEIIYSKLLSENIIDMASLTNEDEALLSYTCYDMGKTFDSLVFYTNVRSSAEVSSFKTIITIKFSNGRIDTITDTFFMSGREIELVVPVLLNDIYGHINSVKIDIYSEDTNTYEVESFNYTRHLFERISFKASANSSYKIVARYNNSDITNYYKLMHAENFKRFTNIPSEKLILDNAVGSPIDGMSIVNVLNSSKEILYNSFLCKGFNLLKTIELNDKYSSFNTWLEFENFEIYLTNGRSYRLINEGSNELLLKLDDDSFNIDRNEKIFNGVSGLYKCKIYYQKIYNLKVKPFYIESRIGAGKWLPLPESEGRFSALRRNNSLSIVDPITIKGEGLFKGINTSKLVTTSIERLSRDFVISCNISAESYGVNGCIGIVFNKDKTTKSAYMYVLKNNNETKNNNYCNIEGLYRIFYTDVTDKQTINTISSGLPLITAEKLSESKESLKGNTAIPLKISTLKGVIQIYHEDEQIPVIEYTDPDFKESLSDSDLECELFVFNMKNPKFNNMTICSRSDKDTPTRSSINKIQYSNGNYLILSNGMALEF